MDSTTETIVDFVAAVSPATAPPQVLDAAKRRFVDTVACAIGGMDSPPAVIARQMAGDVAPRSAAASVLGLAEPTTIEAAAFANTVMARYLDFNDMYFTSKGGGGHPSDLLPGVLAVGEGVGASGSDILRAAAVAYEINGALAEAVWLRERGWDQGLNVVAASAMASGHLLGLMPDELGHALAIAVTANVPVRQTRVGALSMWKACATASAVRNGIFAATLAGHGMTGPADPYAGRSGIWQQVTGEFDITLPVAHESWVIERVATKMHPAEYNAQGILDLAAELRRTVDLEHVEGIDVETYFLAYDEIGSQIEKWDPTTRETADHSIPYLLASALIHGDIGPDSFTPERVRDPSLRPLMQRITVREQPDFTDRFPDELSHRITVTLTDGSQHSAASRHPYGHPRNPATDEELSQKYAQLTQDRRNEPEATLVKEIEALLWNLDTLEDLTELTRRLGRLGTR